MQSLHRDFSDWMQLPLDSTDSSQVEYAHSLCTCQTQRKEGVVAE